MLYVFFSLHDIISANRSSLIASVFHATRPEPWAAQKYLDFSNASPDVLTV